MCKSEPYFEAGNAMPELSSCTGSPIARCFRDDVQLLYAAHQCWHHLSDRSRHYSTR